ncbi:hypothetical protein [Dactylosporangium darangshiense]|uniref:hypothetical protein n=1 Tax=Dactylosporangium darangshiense TaxID=579108 RepID=UPI003644650F
MKADSKVLTTLVADEQGAVEQSMAVAPAGTKPGKFVIVQLTGGSSRRSATAQYRVAN